MHLGGLVSVFNPKMKQGKDSGVVVLGEPKHAAPVIDGRQATKQQQHGAATDPKAVRRRGHGTRGRWRREGKVSREKGVGLPGSRVVALVGCMQGLGGPKEPAIMPQDRSFRCLPGFPGFVVCFVSSVAFIFASCALHHVIMPSCHFFS